MNNVSQNFNISNAENGYIVNVAIEEDTDKDGILSSSYTSETYVFKDWAQVIDWLKNANAAKSA